MILEANKIKTEKIEIKDEIINNNSLTTKNLVVNASPNYLDLITFKRDNIVKKFGIKADGKLNFSDDIVSKGLNFNQKFKSY